MTNTAFEVLGPNPSVQTLPQDLQPVPSLPGLSVSYPHAAST